MRWDMFKVIVERPRLRGVGSRRLGRDEMRARQDPEAAPLRESTSRRRGGDKILNENLAPLRRFVLGQVGRPWDLVHAEICARIGPGNAVQRHILDHLWHFVVRDVIVVDGHPCHRGDGRPLYASRWREHAFVCPTTGLLRRTPPRPRPRPLPARDRVELKDDSQLQRLGGVWYHVRFMPLPVTREELRDAHDVVLRVQLGATDYFTLRRRLTAQHGRADIYAVDKRQLGKRALARLLPEDLR